jgi:hypothetical protein
MPAWTKPKTKELKRLHPSRKIGKKFLHIVIADVPRQGERRNAVPVLLGGISAGGTKDGDQPVGKIFWPWM